MRILLRKIYMNINALIYKTSKDRGCIRSIIGVMGFLFIITRGLSVLICVNIPLFIPYKIDRQLCYSIGDILIALSVIWLIYDLYIKRNYIILLKEERYNNARTHIHAIVMLVVGLIFFLLNMTFISFYRYFS